MMMRGVGTPPPTPQPRSSLATSLLLAALLLTSVFAWFHLILSSHHACSNNATGSNLNTRTTPDTFPSPFPWQPPDFSEEYDPFPSFSSSLLRASSLSGKPLNYSELAMRNIVFGIGGSAQSWPQRKGFIKLWWKPHDMRGFVWLDEPVIATDPPDQLPILMISEDTSSFSKYDPNELYYVGHYSESHLENFIFSYNMAYGGGGVAISYPLAEALVGMFDDCIRRYPHLFGSDDRLHACITELGVPITKELGFHQFDIRGSAFGLLTAHPVAPFISLHHVGMVEPIFPGLETLDSLRLLVKAMQVEPSSFLQQSICYQANHKLSFSISLGYAVQVYPRIVSPRELQKAERTFQAWNGLDFEAEFDINTRPSPSICDHPFTFYLEEIHQEERTGSVISLYKRHGATDALKKKEFCWSHMFSAEKVQQIRVLSKPFDWLWYLVPRRQCCSVGSLVKDGVLDIVVDACVHGIVT
ncbi:hypothetical protein GOP47_0023041 [Adiantum capillus-veneris]|uniref:Uncharacterized protein n=1 Tax=Adiantum capillus-veneris TaxID=13818 RepID=A0A9D4U7M5_ADICA|nr:hypothetical protein GOP47_0023041 [Adiantum capillus-veneris]